MSSFTRPFIHLLSRSLSHSLSLSLMQQFVHSFFSSFYLSFTNSFLPSLSISFIRFMCMYMCMYIYIHTHIYIFVYIVSISRFAKEPRVHRLIVCLGFEANCSRVSNMPNPCAGNPTPRCWRQKTQAPRPTPSTRNPKICPYTLPMLRLQATVFRLAIFQAQTSWVQGFI